MPRRRDQRGRLPDGSAAVSDGGRDAGGPGRVRGPGRRHVRLRDADAQRAQRSTVHQRGAAQHPERPVRRRRRARSIRAAAATRARITRAPTCGTCYMAGEMAARTLNTLHNLTFYLDTMQRIRDAIAFRTFETFRQEFLRLRRQLRAPACHRRIVARQSCRLFGSQQRRFGTWAFRSWWPWPRLARDEPDSRPAPVCAGHRGHLYFVLILGR